MTTFVIDAYEKRVTATADVTGAYLNAKMDEFLVMKIEGDMIGYMVQVDPKKYAPHVRVEHGRKVLYVQILRALYGCIRSGLLWYNLFTKTLKGQGFKLNEYDSCVANKVVNGKQCTITWYVDDLKISHVERAVVDDVIREIESHFGKMSVTHGNKHAYLGMEVEFIGDGKVTFFQKDHLLEAIAAFGEDVSTPVTSAAKKNLFSVNEGDTSLDEAKSDIFHSVTQKLLFVAKRSRPDIQPALSFLCTRVQKSSVTDWEKLKRLLQFINCTIDEKLTLSADKGLTFMKTWVDASYAVHPNMRGHTGGCLALGRGMLHSRSSKQKLNTKSSTECEVVGTSDYLPFPIWFKFFIEAQGYPMKGNDFNQDNTSAISLEKNGIMSCGQQSRHINIRFFFIKDRIREDNINIVYCPTEIMVADYFTKPLQGALFKKLRDVVMGHTHPSSLMKSSESVPSICKERVGISVPMEVKSRIMNGVSILPSDGTDKNYKLPSVRSSILRKPTYAEIVVGV